MTASSISSALRTSTRWTRSGVGCDTGPLTRVTRAPASTAARARAKPIFPELRLLKKRMGSSASCVGPAVISTSNPDKSPLANSAATPSARASEADIRPSPISPQAWAPSSGPRNLTPRRRSCSQFSRVAAFSHIARFIAGATATGARVARQTAVRGSLARPCASRASTSALAGATSTASAHRARAMWPMAASDSGSRKSSRTACPETACRVSGVINLHADGVITTRTSAPASRSRRTTSGLL